MSQLPDSGPDPAARRFFTIHFTRLLGVGFVIVGILVATNRLFPTIPNWLGYLLLANGLLDVFVIPAILVRKWRSPDQEK